MSDCLFCKMISGEIPVRKIYEDEDVFAFYDIAPQAPIHFLVIPKKHIPHVMLLEEDEALLMGKMLFQGQKIAKELGLESSGARFVFNCKEDASQSVWHIHLHVLGGRKFDWPPG